MSASRDNLDISLFANGAILSIPAGSLPIGERGQTYPGAKWGSRRPTINHTDIAYCTRFYDKKRLVFVARNPKGNFSAPVTVYIPPKSH